MIKPSYERIRFLQHQLRTAIQNHHVLLLKSRLFPMDVDLKNQMNILQSLIISMGRTQNDLLYQLQQELDKGLVSQSDAKRHLSQPIPKNIPCFEGNTFSDRHDLTSKPNPKSDFPSAVRCYSKKQSLLKPHIKEGLAKKLPIKSEEMASPRGPQAKGDKKLQSVLKMNVENGTFIKIDLDNKLGGIKRVHGGCDESTPTKVRRTVESDEAKSGSRSNSVSPKPAAAPPPPRRNNIESKTFTRSKRKMAVAAATAAAIAASKATSEVDLNIMEEALKNEPIDPNVPTDDKILSNLETYEEMGKHKFLEHFSLISLSQRDAITVKKCGRKRRTVAGQSSLYNDYFKPSALSMKNPKWRYEMQPVRRASKESAVSKKPPSVMPTEAATEEAVAEASEMAAMEAAMDDCESGAPMSSEEVNSSVVVETALEIDDEEDKEKEKSCIVCRLIGDGSLEICQWCSERYHNYCLSEESRGRCPHCLAQTSSINSIVGEGGAGVSSASSLELIKRYLPT